LSLSHLYHSFTLIIPEEFSYEINYQYNETNAMHFLFNLLRIKGLYIFRVLLAHLQEALNKRHLVYCVRVMSVGCAIPGADNWHKTHAMYQVPLVSASWRWASNAQNMYRPLILNILNKTCITLVSLHWCTVMQGNKTLKNNFDTHFNFTLKLRKFWHIPYPVEGGIQRITRNCVYKRLKSIALKCQLVNLRIQGKA
jgi:hypothetical protein